MDDMVDTGGLKSSAAASKSACDNIRIMLENPVLCSSVYAKNFRESPFVRRLKNVFSILPESVFFVSYPSGDILYMNPAAAKKIKDAGVSDGRKKINEFFSLEGLISEAVLADEEKITAYFKAGSSSELTHLSAVDISEGDLSLMAVYAYSIPEEKKTINNHEAVDIKIISAINAISDAIVVVNRDMEVEIHNDSFKEIAVKNGVHEDLAGKKLSDVSPSLTGRLGLEYRYVLKSGESLDTSVKSYENGKLTYFEVIKTPVFGAEGDVTHVVTMLRDRTKNYHLEELKKEAFFQIEKNMEQFAILNDHIRNPLQAIVGLADLYGGEMGEKIISQAGEINNIVTKLDTGWIESEKVRDMLSKHYGISLKRRPNVKSPVGIFTVNNGTDFF